MGAVMTVTEKVKDALGREWDLNGIPPEDMLQVDCPTGCKEVGSKGSCMLGGGRCQIHLAAVRLRNGGQYASISSNKGSKTPKIRRKKYGEQM